MNTPRRLDVWLSGRKVGVLEQRDGRMAFAYDPPYAADPLALPLSRSLPLQTEMFDDRAAKPFFAGLLPEEAVRTQVARIAGVSERNDFALIAEIGGDCAGAVTFCPPYEMPATRADDWRVLNESQLAAILAELPERPLLAGEDGVRLSLAGAQDKLPVRLVDGHIALPLNGTPSSHILKMPIRRVEDSVYNEGFCLGLARAVGLDAVQTDIRFAGSTPYLLVSRYDRAVDTNGRLQRLHQEDLCQALGIVPEQKYEAEGGPTLRQCVEVVRSATRTPVLHVPKLVDAVLLNALIGNNDAHGKNFSLLYRPEGTALAPLYDLLCTAAYPSLTSRMAMKVGSKATFDELYPRHWERFARDAGLAWPPVRRRLLALAERLPGAARNLYEEFQQKGHARPILQQVIPLIEMRCSIVLERFAKAAR